MSGDEVVILGAGFSHAASSSMPLVKKLGDEVLGRLRADGDRSERLAVLLKQLERTLSDSAAAASPGFEAWLARLAEDQPYVSQRENLERRALFSRVSEVMWEVMVERQDQALTPWEEKDPALGPNEWLYDIVSLFHQRRTTVITLNYDNLVEHAAASSFLWGEPTTPWVVGRAVRTDDLFDGLPPFLPPVQAPEVETSVFGPSALRPAPTVPTFSLLKLHGSLSWFWIPTDPSGTTLAAWNVHELGRGLRDEEARRRDLPGREPFLVPPTTSKASYFETMVTRELWRRAYKALKVAKRVVLVGYSLPAADSTFLGLLADTIVGRDVEVLVVNPSPDAVVTELKRLGVENQRDPVKAVGTWVEQEIRRDAKKAVEQLRLLAERSLERFTDAFVTVGWLAPYAPSAPVLLSVGHIEDSDELVLATKPAKEDPDGGQCTLPDLLTRLDGIGRISADVGGKRATVTQLYHSEPSGPGMRGKIHLFTAGRPKAK